MLSAFFSWWYGRGWKDVVASFKPRLQSVSDGFSVSLLVPTLFEPWKRIITPPGRSLEARFHAWADNMFSRVIGFFVRISVLIAACFVMFFVLLLTAIEVVVWPLIPLAVPGLLIGGFLI